MSKQTVKDFVDKYKARIDEEIEGEIERRLAEVGEISPHLTPVVSAMRELSVGGKRLRGLLTVLGYQLAGGPPTHEAMAVKGGAVMELFHLGLLIQDDWIDQDEKRRGVATIHTRYQDAHTGNFVAMLAGDYTFGWGMEIISKLKVQNSNLIRAMQVWGKYFTRVGYGQTLDGLAVADDKTILQILSIKSGEYTCVLPLLLGATLGDADQRLLTRLGKYGMELGWVFQLRDDWLGEFGDQKKTGKPVGHDSREGKKTYATMYGQDKTEAAIREHWENGKKFAMDDEILLGLLEWMATREN